MKNENYEEYKEHVRKHLDLMTDVFAHISVGDFSKRPDLSACGTGDQFTQALCGLDMMIDDIIESRDELKKLTDKLEREVKERTAELSDANKKLNLELNERKRSEEEIHKSRARFKALAEASGAGIFIVKNSNFVYVNPYFVEVTGYSETELLAMKFWEIVHPDFREVIKNRYIDRMAGKNVAKEYEFKYLKKNGACGWTTMSVGLAEFDEGPAIIGTLFDITERKRAEDELAGEKELLSVTMASIGDGVVSTDTEGLIVSINPVALAFTGRSQEETIGKHLDDVFGFFHEKIPNAPEGIVRSMIKRKGIRPMAVRCGLRTHTGAQRVIDLSVSPINTDDAAVIGMVMVFRDMTERNKLEDELYKARKLESLGVLAGGIAHDFNNILTGIITNLFMVKIKVKSDPDSFQMLDEAEKASFRASRLIKQLMTFSKGGDPVRETVAIKDVIEDSVGFCLSGSNVGYKLQLAPGLPPVEADRGQIDQVINNLVINADQAMPSGGTIVVGAEAVDVGTGQLQEGGQAPALRPGAYVKVSVHDEGVGISRENLEKIFDPYFTTKANGNGLGLTIAYSIINSHNGIITVESEEGKGSLFSFYLPVATRKPPSAGKGKQEKTLAGPAHGRILIMDDDNAVRIVVTQLLKSSGYDVVCTASGEAAIEAYTGAMKKNDPFAAVVMDLTIQGGMGGREAVAKVLEIDKDAKIVVASGYSNDPIMANYRDYGFCGIIAKPFNIDEFLAVIKKASGGA